MVVVWATEEGSIMSEHTVAGEQEREESDAALIADARATLVDNPQDWQTACLLMTKLTRLCDLAEQGWKDDPDVVGRVAHEKLRQRLQAAEADLRNARADYSKAVAGQTHEADEREKLANMLTELAGGVIQPKAAYACITASLVLVGEMAAALSDIIHRDSSHPHPYIRLDDATMSAVVAMSRFLATDAAKGALARREREQAALRWYGEQAEATSRYANANPPRTEGLMAIVTALALDAGKRARTALAAEEAKP